MAKMGEMGMGMTPMQKMGKVRWSKDASGEGKPSAMSPMSPACIVSGKDSPMGGDMTAMAMKACKGHGPE